jgi:hypothetical protein
MNFCVCKCLFPIWFLVLLFVFDIQDQHVMPKVELATPRGILYSVVLKVDEHNVHMLAIKSSVVSVIYY